MNHNMHQTEGELWKDPVMRMIIRWVASEAPPYTFLAREEDLIIIQDKYIDKFRRCCLYTLGCVKIGWSVETLAGALSTIGFFNNVQVISFINRYGPKLRELKLAHEFVSNT